MVMLTNEALVNDLLMIKLELFTVYKREIKQKVIPTIVWT